MIRLQSSNVSSEHTPFAAPAVGVLVLMLSSCALAQEPQPATIAFTGVNVIGLDHEGVDQDQTVLVQGSRIAAVGSRYAVAVPSDGVVIDGTGHPGATQE